MFYCLQIATTAVTVAAQSSHLHTHIHTYRQTIQYVFVYVFVYMRVFASVCFNQNIVCLYCTVLRFSNFFLVDIFSLRIRAQWTLFISKMKREGGDRSVRTTKFLQHNMQLDKFNKNVGIQYNFTYRINTKRYSFVLQTRFIWRIIYRWIILCWKKEKGNKELRTHEIDIFYSNISENKSSECYVYTNMNWCVLDQTYYVINI